jgi:hypothetical protein
MKKQFETVVRLLFLFIFVFAQTPTLAASASPSRKSSGNATIAAHASIDPRMTPSAPGPDPSPNYKVVSQDRFKARDTFSYAVSNPVSVGGAPAPDNSQPSLAMFRPQGAAPLPPAPHVEGGLTIEPITAYNLIVDSNVLAPSSYGPNAATLGAKYCNTSGGTLNDIWAYIGDYTNNTPGIYPVLNPTTYSTYDSTQTFAAAFPQLAAYPPSEVDYGDRTRFYALEQESGSLTDTVDASRYIGTLAAGQCRTEYWLVSYPRKAKIGGSWVDVTGGVKPDDDLWLPYDFWAKSGSNTSYYHRYVTMRNEISAMANKIWPNGDNKVPPEYVAAIQQVLGWDTWTANGSTNIAYPGETVTSQGIWYDFGVVGAGFDNNGDLVPDRNAWVQPIGDASVYDPGCFNLVRTYGLLIVKLNDGTDMLIPFVDQMYFQGLPDNNTGVVGLVFYEYVALDGACTAGLTPYQEVASGYDNEKFNADFGAGIPPLKSQQTNMTFDKSGPTSVARNTTFTYTLTFTLPDVDGTSMTITVGNPSANEPLTYYDAVPVGLKYIGGSATETVDMSSNYGPGDMTAAILHSEDGGLTWIDGDRLTDYTSTSSNNQLILKWRLPSGVTSPASGSAYTGTVTFQAQIPTAFPSQIIDNTACMKIGDADPFLCDDHKLPPPGNSAITGAAWKDDGLTGGIAGDGSINGTEAGIGDGADADSTGVTVKLYWDANGDGDTTDSFTIIDGYVDINGDGDIDSADDGTISGVSIIDGGIDILAGGGITTADDGAFMGYPVMDGRFDMNGDSSVNTGDDGSISDFLYDTQYTNSNGDYCFGGTLGARYACTASSTAGLPAASTANSGTSQGNPRYIIVVDPADGDIPTGYGPSTTTSYTLVALSASSVYGDTQASEPTNFGFMPALKVTKDRLSSSPIVGGQTAQFKLRITNTLPGSGSNSSSCNYYMWAQVAYPTTGFTPPGGGPANSQWADTSYALGSPDKKYSYSAVENNTDVLGLSGFNVGNQGSTISSVEFIADVYERSDLVASDSFHIHTYYNDTDKYHVIYNGDGSWQEGATTHATGGYFTQALGTNYLITYTLDPNTITGRTDNAWHWSDFTNNLLEMQVEANKGSGSTHGNINLDGAGFIVHTTGTCGGNANTILNPVPLIDQYDNRYLEYISAIPLIDGETVNGNLDTLSWSNVGPLYPGQTMEIVVNFIAQTVASSTTTTNYDESQGAKFASGASANSDLMSETDNQASVTIIPATSTRSLSGKVFDDNNTNGWQTAAWSEPGTAQQGYDTGDVGIPYIPVDLYVCMNLTTGTIIATAGANKTCAAAAPGNDDSGWALVRTKYTDTSGNYSFVDLPQGYYYVWVRAEFIAGSQTADVNENGTCSTCDNRSASAATQDLETNPFPGDLSNNTTITNVNFGYNVLNSSSTYNIGDLVFYDWNGNGAQDAEDEPIPGVQFHLTSANGATHLAHATAGTNGIYGFNGYAPAYYTIEVVTSTLPASVVQTYDPDGSSSLDNKSTFALTANDLTRDFGYQPKGAGTIGDTVFVDVNGDGSQNLTEPGIAGVTVKLQVDLDGNGTYVTIKTITTDANGRYLFSDLPVGSGYNYRVVLELDGTNLSKIPNDAYGNDYYHSTGTLDTSPNPDIVYFNATITSAAPNYLTADFGFAPPASIGDTVYQDVNGNGTQDFNEPGLGSVTVTLYTFTDAGDGDHVYDVGEPYYDLNGNSTHDSNEPFFDKDGRYEPGETIGSSVASTTTDSSGHYQFAGLAPGYYLVQVTPPTGTLTGDPNTDGLSCSALTSATNPPNTICDSRDGMRLYNGTAYMGADFGYQINSGSIGDTLWIDSDNDGIRDPEEAGIDNVTVFLCSTSPCNSGSAIATKVTDANGNYTFNGLSAGTYYVAVDTSDGDLTSLGLTQTFEKNSGSPDNQTTVVLTTTTGVTRVSSINGTGCSGCDLDVDFGYRYSGSTSISGTVCLETSSVDGVCGADYSSTSGVGASEAAYDNVVIYLYKLVDNNSNGLFDAGDTTILVSTTTTASNGDYSFTGMTNGVYYIIAVGAPQSGLDLTSTQSSVNTTGDASTTQVVEAVAGNGDTLSVYQVVNTAGDTNVQDRDFAFQANGAFDFGDLPETFATTLQGVPDGPRAQKPASGSFTIYLGAGQPDTETNGQPTTYATGDGADENGVSVPAVAKNDSWNDGDGGTLRFSVTAPSGGWLMGWIDLNKDGDFADANEMIVNQAVSSGTSDINVSSLSGLADGNYPARFRIFTSQPAVPAFAYAGAALDGEVEDYVYHIQGGAPTPVTLSYFKASLQGNTVAFDWSTTSETGNVGFNLYVENGETRTRINNQLIPSHAVDSLNRQDYSYSAQVSGDTFYLEEVSVLGNTELHGPFQVGEEYGSLVDENKIDWNAIQAENKASNNTLTPGLALDFTNLAVNLKVSQSGLYRVTYEMLRDAGYDLSGKLASQVKLTNRGQAVPIYVKSSSKFGPGSYFEFYGQALDTVYTDTNIYRLEVGSPAPRIATSSATPGKGLTPPVSYTDTLTVNHQRAYASFYALEDGWYDTSMLAYTASKTWSFPFDVPNLADANAPATLNLTVWGVTDWPQAPDHHLLVSLNGVSLASELFDGLTVKVIQVTIPAGTLKPGSNSLQLTLPGDTGVQYDMVNFDKFSLTYQRAFQAQDGRLTFTAAGKMFKVTNLPTKNVVVYRQDKSGLVRFNTVQVVASGSTFTATFVGASASATYYVSTVENLYAPTFEAARAPSATLARQAQYLIISHPNFIGGLQPLVQARQAQGLTVNVVDVNDVYAQYSYGIFDPQAIRQYIAYAYKNLGTQYVLLVGGDTYDYRNYLGINSISFIPSLYADTGTARLVPVDPLFADVDGDNVPDLALGRFPVRTTADLALMVNKTLAYANKDYRRTAFFAADMYDGAIDFKNANLNLIATMPTGWTVNSASLDDISLANAQGQLIAAMNNGTALVTFTGHSSPTTWAFSSLFNTRKAAALTNAGRPFVVVQWGCWNIYHIDPVNNYLVQSFLFSGDKGAAAVLGASTLTDSESEELLGQLLTPRLVTPGTSIGQALQQAKAELALTHPELLDVLLGWSLMGDPALVVEP